MKDRIVEHPGRYQLVPVPGTSDQYDFIPVPGEVTEEGTAYNKANQLSDETAEMYGGVITVNDALKRGLNLSSFMAFCSNISPDILDIAFGKWNEDRVLGLGLQMAMFGWTKEDSLLYPKLIQADKLIDCYTALDEINTSNDLKTLIASSPFAASRIYGNSNALDKIFADNSLLSMVFSDTNVVNALRNDNFSKQNINNRMTVLDTVGNGTFIVPDNVYNILACVIAGGKPGNPGIKNYVGGTGGSRGQLVQSIIAVQPGQPISYTVGAGNQNSVFGSITATAGGGSSQTQDGCIIKISENGKNSTAGQGTRNGGGGQGGYGGGDGQSSSLYGGAGGIGSKDIGTLGGGLAGERAYGGGGGGGYGGGGGGGEGDSYGGLAGGAGGQGAIVIYM